MRTYFIYNGVSEVGPYAIEQLKSLGLKGDTPVWYEGLHKWTKAESVEELKPLLGFSSLPPKFEQGSAQNSSVLPPNFSDSNYGNPPNVVPKNSVSLKSILIGVGVLAVVFIGIGIAISNSGSAYEENGGTGGLDTIANAAALERDRINEALTVKNRNYRNNFEKYIQVSTNSYSYSDFGGISNLAVLVSNDTDYLMNEVVVTVDYIKENGEVFKSEQVSVYNIRAHETESAFAPESNRGTSVAVRIDQIRSKKMHFCYYASNGVGTYSDPGNSNDPYFCK